MHDAAKIAQAFFVIQTAILNEILALLDKGIIVVAPFLEGAILDKIHAAEQGEIFRKPHCQPQRHAARIVRFSDEFIRQYIVQIDIIRPQSIAIVAALRVAAIDAEVKAEFLACVGEGNRAFTAGENWRVHDVHRLLCIEISCQQQGEKSQCFFHDTPFS